jgi:transposase-like protein
LVIEDVRRRLYAVEQHLERRVRAADIYRIYGISERSLRYWCQHYRENGVSGLRNESR